MDRIPFDLFAQLSYHHSKVFSFASMIRPPHRLQEPFMSERLAVMNRRHAKHFELLDRHDLEATHNAARAKLDEVQRAGEANVNASV
jgi:hypothetical protein